MQYLAYFHPVSGAVRPVTTELLRAVYLVPRQLAPFDLASTAAQAHYPWYESLSAAPGETCAVLERGLRELMLATATLRPEEIDSSMLAGDARSRAHLDALVSLWRSLGEALPDDLWVMRHVLEAQAGDAIDSLPVIVDGLCKPSAAERALAAKLAEHHGHAPQGVAERHLQQLPGRTPRAAAQTLLGHIQRNLLQPTAISMPQDGSVSAFGMRDAFMQADVAAGMAQKLLEQDPTLRPADIGLLVPRADPGNLNLPNAFRRAGLPLSGLPAGPDRRDVAGEMLQNFLITRRRPAPSMALAALLSSPLMPWEYGVGREMANDVMRSSYNPRAASSLSGRARRAFALLREDVEPTASVIAGQLVRLTRLLTREPALREDVDAARVMADQLGPRLRAMPGAAVLAPDELARLVLPAAASSTMSTVRSTGGITVICDDEEPWRPVRHLLVLSYCDGRYPSRAPSSPFFLNSEIGRLEEFCALALAGRQQTTVARLELLQRQIGAASDSLTLLVPGRDIGGKRMAPASSLPLVTRCVAGVVDAENFITDLDAVPDEDWPDRVPRALEIKSLPVGPPQFTGRSLELDRDLFGLRQRDDGTARRQSPSRLETLIVSPFAWLLNELDAVDSVWAPETLDVGQKGTLAHHVFENLFLPDQPLPTAVEIADRVPRLLGESIRRIAPFIQAAAWALERASLQDEILQSALRWRESLISTGATVIMNEFALTGSIFGVEVHGRADCLLQLQDGQFIIVDHKKSGTSRRQQRLDAGWDLQVELYRRMARNPDSGDEDGEEFRAMLASANSLGVAYHLMNDGGVLVHGPVRGPAGGAFSYVDSDISSEALRKLEDEIARLRRGEVALNTQADRAFFGSTAKTGLFAFDVSPLVDAFSLAVEEGEGALDD